MKNEAKLARLFVLSMNAVLSDSELLDVNVQNKRDGYDPATCASHNFCDANEVMLDALRSYLGITQDRDGEWTLDDHIDRVNKAWQAAKMMEYDPTRAKAFELQAKYVDEFSETGESNLAELANELAVVSGLWIGAQEEIELLTNQLG